MKKPSKDETTEWVAAWLKSHDQDAAGKLTQALQPYVRSAASRVVAKNQVDDVVQDSFMQIFRKLHTFKGDSRLESWAYRVARNQALMRIRSQSRRPREVEIKDDTRVTRSLSAQLEARAELRKVESMLEDMQNDDAETLRRYVFGRLSLEEVATNMGLTVAAVKSRIFRARRDLTARMNVSLPRQFA